MGEIADWMVNKATSFMPKRRAPVGRNKLWTMANGQTIRIRDMDNGHLLNTIRMLERKAAVCGAYDAVLAELDLGPDFDFDWASTEDYYPIYADMIDEAARRGLDLSTVPYKSNRIASADEFPVVK